MKVVLALLFISVCGAAVIQPVKDVGEVPCANGTVQLTGGPNEYEGRVEFCANGGWVQVCGGGAWGPIPASLVCLSLQNSTIIRSFDTIVNSGYYGVNNLPTNSVNIRNTRCNRNGRFSDCVNMKVQNQGCGNGLLATVACPANCEGKSVRLISDSPSSAGGLVEICVQERISLWTGVCHNNFTLASAAVVCRQLGLLRNDSSVTISHSPIKHWHTYDTLRCIGNESNISECQLAGYKEGAGCNSVIVNCQGVDGTTVPPEGATGSEFSSSTASSVTTGDSSTESNLTSSQSSSDMLIIITGTVCGIVIVLLLIAVTMLTLILVTKSRNSRRRLKDVMPTIVNGSRTPVYSPNYVQTPSDHPSPPSQSSTLKKLTINASGTSMSEYAEPSNTGTGTTIQTVPLPIPTEGYSYPMSNPQRDSGIILPQLDTFLPPPEADPADDVHIYAEPDEPGFNSQCHDYAELEACVDRHQNSMMPAHHRDLAGPQPYEVPTVVGGSYVNVTSAPEPINTCTHSTARTGDNVGCQNVTSLTVDHQYATPGLPS